MDDRDLDHLANEVAARVMAALDVENLVEQIAHAVILRLQATDKPPDEECEVAHADAPGRYSAHALPSMIRDGVVFKFKADNPAIIHMVPSCCTLMVNGKPVGIPMRVTSEDDIRVVLNDGADPTQDPKGLFIDWEEFGPPAPGALLGAPAPSSWRDHTTPPEDSRD